MRNLTLPKLALILGNLETSVREAIHVDFSARPVNVPAYPQEYQTHFPLGSMITALHRFTRISLPL